MGGGARHGRRSSPPLQPERAAPERNAEAVERDPHGCAHVVVAPNSNWIVSILRAKYLS